MRDLKVNVVDLGRLGKWIRLEIANSNGIVQIPPEDARALAYTLNILSTAAREGRDTRSNFEPC